MPDFEDPIPTPRAQRLAGFRRRRLPVIVWAVAAAVCAVALFERGRRIECVGIAEARQYEISAAVDGVIERIEVAPLESVDAGAVIVRLDDAALRARMEVSRARIHQLSAQLEAAQHETRAGAANLAGELLRVQIDEDRQRLEATALRGQIEAEAVEIERLDLEARRQGALFEEGLVASAAFDDARLKAEAAHRRLEEDQRLLAQAEREQRAAEDRRRRHEQALLDIFAADPVLRPLREAVIVEGRVLDEIEIERAATVLRAPAAGQVTEVLCRPGQAVVPGEPIVMIVGAEPTAVVAWLGERDDRDVRPGVRVRLTTHESPVRTAESVVLRGGEGIQALPPRLWRDPRAAEYGRAVVVAPVPDLRLDPGELVGVRFLED